MDQFIIIAKELGFPALVVLLLWKLLVNDMRHLKQSVDQLGQKLDMISDLLNRILGKLS